MGISFKRKSPGGRYDREHQERTRQKIADANVLTRLLKGFNGEVELTSHQVAIGLKLIDKLVPNLQSVEQEITQNAPFAVIPQPAKDAKTWESSLPAAVKGPEKPQEARTAAKAPGRSPSALKH
jgi:hypothetical protein